MDRYAFLDATEDDRLIIDSIAKRAIEMNDKIESLSLEMDLLLAHSIFNLRLDDLLKARRFDFSHDIYGIMNNINRKELIFENFFVPRFATQ